MPLAVSCPPSVHKENFLRLVFFFVNFFFPHEARQYLKGSCSFGFCYVSLCTLTEIHEGLEREILQVFFSSRGTELPPL